jgi:hypothetical protein
VLPRELDVGDVPGHEDQVEVAFAEDLVGDVDVVALRVLGLGRCL